LHGFVAANKVFQGAGDNVVNAGHAIGAGWTLVKHKMRLPFAEGYTFVKSFLLFPSSQHFLLNGGEVEACKFSIFSVHNLTTLSGTGKLGALPFIKWAKVLKRAVAWEGDFGGGLGGICRFCLIFKRKKTIGGGYLVNLNGIKQTKKYVQNH
jgi:hypothetical protein